MVYLIRSTDASQVSRESGRRQGVLEAKRRFVRFISHEIRTPLNTMHLGLDLFRIGTEPPYLHYNVL
jgi:signal transduction histidine kinase